MKRLLIVGCLIALVAGAGFQAIRIAEANRSLQSVSEKNRQLEIYMKQQMWLYNAALAADANDRLLQPAMEKLNEVQQRRRDSVVVHPESVSIIDVPDLMLAEQQNYAWQVHVPVATAIEVFGFQGGGRPTAEDAATPLFRHELPTGESSIALRFRGHYQGTWGNTLPEEQHLKHAKVFAEACVDDQVIWQKNMTMLHARWGRRNRFDTATTILASEPSVELLDKSSIHLGLRIAPEKEDAQ